MSAEEWESLCDRVEGLSGAPLESSIGELPKLDEDQRAALWIYGRSTSPRGLGGRHGRSAASAAPSLPSGRTGSRPAARALACHGDG